MRASNAEYEVLKELWNHPEGIRQPALLKELENKGKEWKRQTVNTLLYRLEQKGMIDRTGGVSFTKYTEDEYNYLVMKENLDAFYGGDIMKFVKSFTEMEKRNTCIKN